MIFPLYNYYIIRDMLYLYCKIIDRYRFGRVQKRSNKECMNLKFPSFPCNILLLMASKQKEIQRKFSQNILKPNGKS